MYHRSRLPTAFFASSFLALCLSPADMAYGQQSSAQQSRTERSEDREESSDSDKKRDGDRMPVFVSDSNTGYIDNATIGTRFRVRVDGGFGVDSPDRAEFFYGACGCARDVPNPPSQMANPGGNVLNPDAPGPSGVVDENAILFSPLIETNLDFQELRFDFEYELVENFSLFVELPFRFVDGDVLGSNSGVGDVRAGFKWGLIDDPRHDLTVQLRGYFPTGDARKALGTDHGSIEPGLLYFGHLNERWTMAAELRYWKPIDGTTGRGTGFGEDYAGDVIRYGVGFGYDYVAASGMTITPVLEVVGWSVKGGLALSSSNGAPVGTLDPGFGYREVDGENILNLKFGLRFGLGDSQKHSLYVGYGTALTDDVWYDDVVRVEFRTDYGR